MDIRGCRTPEEIEVALSQLDAQGIEYEILFLDAPDDVLMRRYSETRRRHPMSISDGLSTREAFRREREILQPLKDRADYTINTGLLSTSQNKERICNLFNQNGGAKSAMRLTVMSFGFKFGIPPEADLVLDVRCLPNPFYVPELKHKTGLDEEVVDFVMSHPEAQELLKRYESFLEYALRQGRQKPAHHRSGLHRRQASLHHICTENRGILRKAWLQARHPAPRFCPLKG
jgi:UPF0042 nucleotide-binding protein